MTRSEWARHATTCPWRQPMRRCGWGDCSFHIYPGVKCRERKCALLDPDRSPYGKLFRMLARYETIPTRKP